LAVPFGCLGQIDGTVWVSNKVAQLLVSLLVSLNITQHLKYNAGKVVDCLAELLRLFTQNFITFLGNLCIFELLYDSFIAQSRKIPLLLD